jgi:hypothetical protein
LYRRRKNVDKEGNVMLGVRLIQADLSSIGGAGKAWDPFAVVKCEKSRKYSKAITSVSHVFIAWTHVMSQRNVSEV